MKYFELLMKGGEKMYKRILLSLGIILVVGGAAFYGTRALLSDQANLTDVTFSTGTVDLQIARDDTPWQDNVAGFTISNAIFPGETDQGFFWLRNTSAVGLDLTGQASGKTGAVSASDIIITIIPVLDVGNTPTGEAVTGPFTLQQWIDNPIPLADSPLGNGDHQRYRMDIKLDSSVDEAGSLNTFDFTFTGTQVSP